MYGLNIYHKICIFYYIIIIIHETLVIFLNLLNFQYLWKQFDYYY